MCRFFSFSFPKKIKTLAKNMIHRDMSRNIWGTQNTQKKVQVPKHQRSKGHDKTNHLRRRIVNDELTGKSLHKNTLDPIKLCL